MHLDEGTLQSYVDQELPNAELERVLEHLEVCCTCRGKADQITTRTERVGQNLQLIKADSFQIRTSTGAARARLEARLTEKEASNMLSKWFSKRLRPVWAGLLVVALLALALAFPPVRAIANNFLGLFRVDRITVVPVDENQLSDRLQSSKQLENLFSENVSYTGGGNIQTVKDAQEASSLANIPVRLPAAAGAPPQLLLQPGGSISMAIDVRQLRAILEEVGQTDVKLSDTLNGEIVSVTIPNLVMALYGECSDPTAEQTTSDRNEAPVAYGSDCTQLIQMQSPTVNAPPDLDINQLGNAFLQILGMDPDDAAQFAASVDWTSTLVLPLPRSNTTYQDVTVDGVPGTLIIQGKLTDPYHYLLVWVKNGVVYGLSGNDNPDHALELANSMQ